MKRKIRNIVLILMLLTIIVKAFQINMLMIFNRNIENFSNFNNSIYEVKTFKNDEKINEIIRKVKDNEFLEYDEFISENIVFFKYINTEKNEGLIAHSPSNNKYYYDYENENYRGLRNSPEITRTTEYVRDNIKTGNIIPIFYCFKILYIIPYNYNGTACYKIRTTKEILYVEKETLYPIHLEYYEKNSLDDSQKIEVEYVFKTDCVTDEDIKIPDIENYTLVDLPY